MKQGHGLRTYKKYSSEISLPFLGLKGLYLRDLIFYREGEGGEPRLGGHHIGSVFLTKLLHTIVTLTNVHFFRRSAYIYGICN